MSSPRPSPGGPIPWHAPEAPLWRWLLAVCAVATAVPMWTGRYLPIGDLPHHAAAIASLRHYWDPAWRVEEHYFVDFNTPYVLYYFVATLVTFIVGSAERANLILVSLMAVAFPYALRAVLRAFGSDERLAFFGCLLFWNRSLMTGFFNYVAAIPLMLWLLAVLVRQSQTPTRRRALGLAAGALAIYFLHIIVFILFAACAAVILTLLVPPARPDWLRELAGRLRALPRRLLWLLPALLLSLVWVSGFLSHHEDSAAAPFMKMLLGEMLGRLPWALRGFIDGAFNIWHSRLDELGLFALIGLCFVLAWPQERPPETAQARWRRSVGLVLFVMCGLAYFVVPDRWRHFANLAWRISTITLLFFPLLLRPAPGRRGALPLAGLAALSLYASVVAVYEVQRFNREVGPFDQVLAQAAPGKRLLGLIYDTDSHSVQFRAFKSFPSYYQVRGGGVASFSFSELPHIPLRFRPTAAPPLKRLFWEWYPCEFRNAIDGPYYDYVLVRGEFDPFAYTPPGPRWQRKAHAGQWTLYEKLPGPPIPPGPDPGACPAGWEEPLAED